MARRTVENFNGFVAARPPAKKPTAVPRSKVVPPQPQPGPPTGRPKPTKAVVNVKKSVSAPAVKTTGAGSAPPQTTKKDLLNAHPSAKVDKPRRIIAEKKPPVIMKIKPEDNKTRHTEMRTVGKDEKVMDTINKSSFSNRSLDGSDIEEYEDDFEDYESDFESDTSIESLSRVPAPSFPVEVDNGVRHNTLPVCVEEKVEPFLDEKFEINSLERTVEMGLKNFQTAGKRKREQETKDKIQTRGNILMGMIKLDTVSYTLLDLPAIPYEQYIKMYGRSNTTQIQTQTHDENAEKEIQTNDIDFIEKWTQHPIVLPNDLDCSSIEYLSAKSGVGGTGSKDDHRRLARITTIDPDRVCVVGRTILSMLDQQAMERAERRLLANKFDVAFSNGYLSPAVSAVKFLAKRPVTSVQFARITSQTESLVTTHKVMDPCYQYILCIWSVSNMENPEYVFKCPNCVTSFCAIFKPNSGFVATAHTDGSICMWDLRESRLHHQRIDGISCPLRSPSFNTAISVDQGHRSKIVSLSTVTYSHVGDNNEELPDEICSLDEDFVLTVWTVVDSWIDTTEISNRNSAGTAPWSSVRLVKMQTAKSSKNVPRYLSDGVIATCMCLNNNQDAFIGTNSGLIFRCNLGEHKVCPTYYTHEDTGEHFSINWLEICPFDSNYFLSACSNGEVSVYCTGRREALRRLIASQGPNSALVPIVKAQWCTGFPGIVFGLDSLSSIHLWDFCDDSTTPMISVPFRDKTVTSMSLSSMRIHQNTYVGLAFDDGAVEIHQMKMDQRTTADDDGTDNNYGDRLARILAGL